MKVVQHATGHQDEYQPYGDADGPVVRRRRVHGADHANAVLVRWMGVGQNLGARRQRQPRLLQQVVEALRRDAKAGRVREARRLQHCFVL